MLEWSGYGDPIDGGSFWHFEHADLFVDLMFYVETKFIKSIDDGCDCGGKLFFYFK